MTPSVGAIVMASVAVLRFQQPSVSGQEQQSSFARVYPADTPGLAPLLRLHAPLLQITPEAAAAKLNGSIDLAITVAADGYVRDPMVTKSPATSYGMDERAVEAASQSVFVPPMLNGQPVAVRTSVTFALQLR